LLHGQGNVDDNWIDLPEGPYHAASLRAFDPSEGLWSIWWLDARSAHTLDVPVRGRFENGVGRFFADDVLKGQPVCVRFIWSDITANSATWQQAFSSDGGASWETNWFMKFTRQT
jgi:hypothetical protein